MDEDSKDWTHLLSSHERLSRIVVQSIELFGSCLQEIFGDSLLSPELLVGWKGGEKGGEGVSGVLRRRLSRLFSGNSLDEKMEERKVETDQH